MKRYLRDYSFLALVAGLVITLDQISKAYVRSHLQLGQMWAPWDWLMPYARIVYWSNTGVAFGMFQGRGQLFTLLSLLISIAIIYYFPRVSNGDPMLRLAMGLQLGGAIGNLIDRITIGHVIDFISVGNFPVFNVADSSITIGVIVLVLGVWLQERQQKRQNADSSSGSSADGETIH